MLSVFKVKSICVNLISCCETPAAFGYRILDNPVYKLHEKSSDNKLVVVVFVKKLGVNRQQEEVFQNKTSHQRMSRPEGFMPDALPDTDPVLGPLVATCRQ